jgi:hypothetical protein
VVWISNRIQIERDQFRFREKEKLTFAEIGGDKVRAAKVSNAQPPSTHTTHLGLGDGNSRKFSNLGIVFPIEIPGF